MSAAASAATAQVANLLNQNDDDRADIKPALFSKFSKQILSKEKFRRGYDNGTVYTYDAAIPRHQRKI